MAYSDYGGYAYRNGEHVLARSDTVLTPEGVQSTPGQWPGWTLEAGRNGGAYHVLLGDGPIFVGLYKQSYVKLHRLAEDLELTDFIVDAPEGAVEMYNEGRWLNAEHFKTTEEPAHFEIDGHKLTLYFLIGDNHYCYAKLEQPDGTVWTGFSGYGVGAGLEDGGHGYSTDACVAKLEELFPS